ncbi:unnamed protein product [Vitrella brassicaformis CCMP3155]|uniref:Uncharacterized protein n=1 Tax=Vitrella brassicaformis (strain CCMP3155) TaxID=1169540 RepID=A0A0G4GBI4_VITBC|nr:unnamed protein product [Vitrella brassicaformis CCMP3155]|eukprot:CEM26033.1 unnamed protein product [Vitrella brassicaformis CCMP3155]
MWKLSPFSSPDTSFGRQAFFGEPRIAGDQRNDDKCRTHEARVIFNKIYRPNGIGISSDNKLITVGDSLNKEVDPNNPQLSDNILLVSEKEFAAKVDFIKSGLIAIDVFPPGYVGEDVFPKADDCLKPTMFIRVMRAPISSP